MATRPGKRQFGSIRKLPSGRFQARYTGPDGYIYAARRENGQPLNFETKGDANDWLSLRRSEILRNDCAPPNCGPAKDGREWPGLTRRDA